MAFFAELQTIHFSFSFFFLGWAKFGGNHNKNIYYFHAQCSSIRLGLVLEEEKEDIPRSQQKSRVNMNCSPCVRLLSLDKLLILRRSWVLPVSFPILIYVPNLVFLFVCLNCGDLMVSPEHYALFYFAWQFVTKATHFLMECLSLALSNGDAAEKISRRLGINDL